MAKLPKSAMICLGIALFCFLAIFLAPKPWAVPLKMSYKGEVVQNKPFTVDKDGTYEVECVVRHTALVDDLKLYDLPVKATVTHNGQRVGDWMKGFSNSEDEYGYRVYEFQGEAGETYNLSVSPTPNWQLISGLRPGLKISRLPEEEKLRLVWIAAFSLLGFGFGVVGMLITFLKKP